MLLPSLGALSLHPTVPTDAPKRKLSETGEGLVPEYEALLKELVYKIDTATTPEALEPALRALAEELHGEIREDPDTWKAIDEFLNDGIEMSTLDTLAHVLLPENGEANATCRILAWMILSRFNGDRVLNVVGTIWLRRAFFHALTNGTDAELMGALAVHEELLEDMSLNILESEVETMVAQDLCKHLVARLKNIPLERQARALLVAKLADYIVTLHELHRGNSWTTIALLQRIVMEMGELGAVEALEAALIFDLAPSNEANVRYEQLECNRKIGFALEKLVDLRDLSPTTKDLQAQEAAGGVNVAMPRLELKPDETGGWFSFANAQRLIAIDPPNGGLLRLVRACRQHRTSGYGRGEVTLVRYVCNLMSTVAQLQSAVVMARNPWQFCQPEWADRVPSTPIAEMLTTLALTNEEHEARIVREVFTKGIEAVLARMQAPTFWASTKAVGYVNPTPAVSLKNQHAALLRADRALLATHHTPFYVMAELVDGQGQKMYAMGGEPTTLTAATRPDGNDDDDDDGSESRQFQYDSTACAVLNQLRGIEAYALLLTVPQRGMEGGDRLTVMPIAHGIGWRDVMRVLRQFATFEIYHVRLETLDVPTLVARALAYMQNQDTYNTTTGFTSRPSALWVTAAHGFALLRYMMKHRSVRERLVESRVAATMMEEWKRLDAVAHLQLTQGVQRESLVHITFAMMEYTRMLEPGEPVKLLYDNMVKMFRNAFLSFRREWPYGQSQFEAYVSGSLEAIGRMCETDNVARTFILSHGATKDLVTILQLVNASRGTNSQQVAHKDLKVLARVWELYKRSSSGFTGYTHYVEGSEELGYAKDALRLFKAILDGTVASTGAPEGGADPATRMAVYKAVLALMQRPTWYGMTRRRGDPFADGSGDAGRLERRFHAATVKPLVDRLEAAVDEFGKPLPLQGDALLAFEELMDFRWLLCPLEEQGEYYKTVFQFGTLEVYLRLLRNGTEVQKYHSLRGLTQLAEGSAFAYTSLVENKALMPYLVHLGKHVYAANRGRLQNAAQWPQGSLELVWGKMQHLCALMAVFTTTEQGRAVLRSNDEAGLKVLEQLSPWEWVDDGYGSTQRATSAWNASHRNMLGSQAKAVHALTMAADAGARESALPPWLRTPTRRAAGVQPGVMPGRAWLRSLLLGMQMVDSPPQPGDTEDAEQAPQRALTVVRFMLDWFKSEPTDELNARNLSEARRKEVMELLLRQHAPLLKTVVTGNKASELALGVLLTLVSEPLLSQNSSYRLLNPSFLQPLFACFALSQFALPVQFREHKNVMGDRKPRSDEATRLGLLAAQVAEALMRHVAEAYRRRDDLPHAVQIDLWIQQVNDGSGVRLLSHMLADGKTGRWSTEVKTQAAKTLIAFLDMIDVSTSESKWGTLFGPNRGYGEEMIVQMWAAMHDEALNFALRAQLGRRLEVVARGSARAREVAGRYGMLKAHIVNLEVRDALERGDCEKLEVYMRHYAEILSLLEQYPSLFDVFWEKFVINAGCADVWPAHIQTGVRDSLRSRSFLMAAALSVKEESVIARAKLRKHLYKSVKEEMLKLRRYMSRDLEFLADRPIFLFLDDFPDAYTNDYEACERATNAYLATYQVTPPYGPQGQVNNGKPYEPNDGPSGRPFGLPTDQWWTEQIAPSVRSEARYLAKLRDEVMRLLGIAQQLQQITQLDSEKELLQKLVRIGNEDPFSPVWYLTRLKLKTHELLSSRDAQSFTFEEARDAYLPLYPPAELDRGVSWLEQPFDGDGMNMEPPYLARPLAGPDGQVVRSSTFVYPSN